METTGVGKLIGLATTFLVLVSLTESTGPPPSAVRSQKIDQSRRKSVGSFFRDPVPHTGDRKDFGLAADFFHHATHQRSGRAGRANRYEHRNFELPFAAIRSRLSFESWSKDR